MKSKINSIESSYEDSYNRNKNMLSFLQILIDNYYGSVEMENNILNNKSSIYQYKGKYVLIDIDVLIRYYNEYNIIEKIKIE